MIAEEKDHSIELRPFQVEIDDAVLDDLRGRLERTRWVDDLPGSGWDYGVAVAYLRELCEHWRTAFDWRAAEARLNAFPQHVTDINGLGIHFLHVRSPEPDALPLILTHGWPGSVAEFLDVLGPLSDPAAHGGDRADAFNVVVPSLPGFGFSGPSSCRVTDRRVAQAFAELMGRLGYERYVAQGGDIGAQISALLGELDAGHVAAVHLNLLPVGPPADRDPFAGLSAEDAALAQRTLAFLDSDTGYWKIQGTRPHTVGSALMDSPAGLAGWIVDKFRSWTDCDGDVERAFTKDQLLTNITIYWVTQTIASSARWYYENAGVGGQSEPPRVEVPTGYADFPGEHYRMPLAWARPRINIVHVSSMPKGGHFAALQVPDLFVDELRTFFRAFR
ncbi:epoxide hydrolase [Frankia sp. Cas4]|uniref:epoxide hydrolase family protein n=1 Tax=Frankia sp. Cas4 TaxID=3073927 RepID=UPI002AD34912|nr:epoxide hydrolase [Frankia sp. Cas4]